MVGCSWSAAGRGGGALAATGAAVCWAGTPRTSYQVETESTVLFLHGKKRSGGEKKNPGMFVFLWSPEFLRESVFGHFHSIGQ